MYVVCFPLLMRATNFEVVRPQQMYVTRLRCLRLVLNTHMLAVYANSCLATLNTRKFIRGRGTDNNHNTGPSFAMVNRTLTALHESKLHRV